MAGKKTKEKIRVSYSQLSIARSCLRKYRHMYISKREPITEVGALSFGRLWHELMEAWWTDGLDKVHEWFKAEAANIEPQVACQLIALAEVYNPPRGAYEVVGVEVESTFHMVDPNTGKEDPTVTMYARADALIRDAATDDLWVLEHKTTSDDVEGFGPFWQRLSIDQQTSVYAGAFGAVGVLYDAVRKPGIKLCGKDETVAKHESTTPADAYLRRLRAELNENHERYFQIRPIRFTLDDLDEARFDILHQVHLLREACSRNMYPRNTDSCLARFGTCWFLDVCTGRALLSDDSLFRERTHHGGGTGE